MEKKELVNKYYTDAIFSMEKGESVSTVRNLLFKVIDELSLLAKLDKEMSDLSNKKSKFLLEQCKLIRNEKSYLNVYKNLTGNDLLITPIEKEPEAIPTKREAVKEIKHKGNESNSSKPSRFNWDNVPTVSFDDVAGLEDVKEEVFRKVIQPLTNPSLYEGYDKKNGGGLLLYGPPGTGKTMIAAAIAREIGAKFCCIGASDLLNSGIGSSEKAIAQLFAEARNFKCAVIFFDEVEALCPTITHAQVARQVRSELLRQMQGLESYGKDTGNILYLIGATNKPWDVDPAFVRPGRFGTKVYVGLPDFEARRYIIKSKLDKIASSGKVSVSPDIDYEKIVTITDGFNGADMSYLLDEVQERSIERAKVTNEKIIKSEDFEKALSCITSSVQQKDLDKLKEWKESIG